jgi:hypothetical protein
MASKKLKVQPYEEEEVDVREVLKKDESFKKYRRIVKVISENVDVEKLDTEVMNLHAGRSSRRLYGSVPTADKMINAALQDGSNRSRIAEIRTELTKQLALVERATSTIKKYILNEFREQTSGLKTKGERMSYADQYVARGVALIGTLEDLISRCDFLIKDIDQMGFSLKVSMTALTILYSHKNDTKGI